MPKTLRTLHKLLISATLFAWITSGCNNVPDNIINPDKMADLMADIRIADAVTTVRRSEYTTDASKLALRDAVLKKHDVSPEQFDSSLAWYGRNIDVYQDVTKSTIEKLETRLREADVLAAGEAAMSLSGDSVDIWDNSRTYIITDRAPSKYIAFNYESDPNWAAGDVYTLRSHMMSQPKYAQWNLTVNYTDGTIETITSNISLDSPLRQELTLVTDSTRTPEYISGWINVEPVEYRSAIVDSLSLTRRRNSAELAKTRKYSQKRIIPKNESADTISD